MVSHAKGPSLPLKTSSSLSRSSFEFFREFFSTWLKLDLTTLAAALTIYNTLSSTGKDFQAIGLKIYWWFTRFFTASISVTGNDRLSLDILSWISAQILPQRGTRILTARTETVQTSRWYTETSSRNDHLHDQKVPIKYLPTFGTMWFMYQRNIFILRRINTNMKAQESTPEEYVTAPNGDEPLVVMVLGRSVKPIQRFFDMCRKFADEHRRGCTTVHKHNRDQYHHGRSAWNMTILRTTRPLSSVHFDESIKDLLVVDIEKYIDRSTRKFYANRGIPYRRGYLLHGPPGGGKTSLSLALAGHFSLELYLCHLPSLQDDDDLDGLFSTLPPQCIVLLEDIDAVGRKRRGKSEDHSGIGNEYSESDDSDEEEEEKMIRPGTSRCRCTLAGLLNVLDGASSQEGRIILMTSNRPSKLDDALLRPGRIDTKIFMGYISKEAVKLMFLRMYTPGEEESLNYTTSDVEVLEKLACEFSAKCPNDTFSPAELQGYLLDHRQDPNTALQGLSEWVQKKQTALDDAKRRAEEVAARKEKKRLEKIEKKRVGKILNAMITDEK